MWAFLIVFFDNLSPKLKSIPKLKQALQVIWDNLPPRRLLKISINKRLNACVKNGDGHIKFLH